MDDGIYQSIKYLNMTHFFYQVEEFASTFGNDQYGHEPFSYTRVFKDKDPLIAREKALDWYRERMRWYAAAGGYFLRWGAPGDEGAAHSITLNLVTSMFEYPIFGGDEEEVEDARDLEQHLFKELGDVELSY